MPPKGKFFLQAEDGIRVETVTGVQTCFLPIWVRTPRNDVKSWPPMRIRSRRRGAMTTVSLASVRPRSEEHTSELQSQFHLVCRPQFEKKKIVMTSNLQQTPISALICGPMDGFA